MSIVSLQLHTTNTSSMIFMFLSINVTVIQVITWLHKSSSKNKPNKKNFYSHLSDATVTLKSWLKLVRSVRLNRFTSTKLEWSHLNNLKFFPCCSHLKNKITPSIAQTNESTQSPLIEHTYVCTHMHTHTHTHRNTETQTHTHTLNDSKSHLSYTHVETIPYQKTGHILHCNTTNNECN